MYLLSNLKAFDPSILNLYSLDLELFFSINGNIENIQYIYMVQERSLHWENIVDLGYQRARHWHSSQQIVGLVQVQGDKISIFRLTGYEYFLIQLRDRLNTLWKWGKKFSFLSLRSDTLLWWNDTQPIPLIVGLQAVVGIFQRNMYRYNAIPTHGFWALRDTGLSMDCNLDSKLDCFNNLTKCIDCIDSMHRLLGYNPCAYQHLWIWRPLIISHWVGYGLAFAFSL